MTEKDALEMSKATDVKGVYPDKIMKFDLPVIESICV
jgi:hypothetical protein